MNEHAHESDVEDLLNTGFPADPQPGVVARFRQRVMIRELTKVDRGPVEFGPFELEKELGHGGMGTVFRAENRQHSETVALKILHPYLFDSPAAGRAQSVREAVAMAEVVHRNVVRVNAVGVDDGDTWISMECVDGGTLRQWQDKARASRGGRWKSIVHKYVDAGRGLAFAHSRDVIHGDFKPDNVLLDARGVPKVTDFGLARRFGADGAPGGTLLYMAPELFTELHSTKQADQFAFCVALFEALTGTHPFASPDTEHGPTDPTHDDEPNEPNPITDEQRYHQQLYVNASLDRPRRDLLGELSRKARRALLRGLRADPARRFETMDALLDQLDDRGDRKRRGRWIGALVLAGAGVGLGFGLRPRPAPAPSALCSQGADRYATVWDNGLRERLDFTLDPQVALQIQQVVEHHRGRWVDAYQQGCSTSYAQDDPAQWARVEQCLDRRLADVRSGLVAASDGDSDIATRVVESLASAAPAACVLRSPKTATDESPPEPATLRDIRTALAGARVSEVKRNFDPAIAELDTVIERAKDLHYRPLLAEAYYQRGRLRLFRARYQTRERRGMNTAGFDDLDTASNLAGMSGSSATMLDVAIFRRRAQAILGIDAPPLELDRLLDGTDNALFRAQQAAELSEIRGIALRYAARSESDPSRAIAMLEEAVEHFDAALATNERQGYALGVARARGNLSRALVDLGGRQKRHSEHEANADSAETSDLLRERSRASLTRAVEEIERANELWVDAAYGHNYFPAVHGQVINAWLLLDRRWARTLSDQYRERYRDQPQVLHNILVPALLAYHRDADSPSLADHAMAVVEHQPPGKIMTIQLRLHALGNLAHHENAALRSADVAQWAAALEPLVPKLAAGAPPLHLLATAYLGRAAAVRRQWAHAVRWLDQARAHEHWASQTHVTKTEVLADLALALAQLGRRAAALEAVAEAEQWLSKCEPTNYRVQLAGRLDGARASLGL